MGVQGADRDADSIAQFFQTMLDGGIYLAPSPFEAGFVSTVHGDAELTLLRTAADRAFGSLSGRPSV